MTKITTTYEDWNSVPRGSGKALCQAPSVAAMNSKLAAPLRWDATEKAWTGSVEQATALAVALETKGQRILDAYGDGSSGIAARLTVTQGKRMIRVAASIRETLSLEVQV